MSSADERLARLEVLVSEQRDDIKEMRAQLNELTRQAHMGKGAIALFITAAAAIGWIADRAMTFLMGHH